MTLAIRREPLTPALIEELAPLAAAACGAVHGLPADFDLAAYLELAALGRYALWVVRDANRGWDVAVPVGLCGMILSRHQHLGLPAASQDVLYLLPAYRRGALGLAFLRQVNRELLESGFAFVYRHAPSGSGLSALYARAGGRLTESVFEWSPPQPCPRTI